MSYILEALKKSEKERQLDEIPDLQADHSLPPSKREERKSPVWRTPKVVISGAACVAALLWWKLSAEPPVSVAETPLKTIPAASVPEIPPQKVSQVVEKADAVLPVVNEQPVKKNSQAVAHSEKPSSPSVATVGRKKIVSRPTAVLTSAPIPARKIDSSPPEKAEFSLPPLMEDLPVAIRAGIPDLTFAGHVYSEVAAKRLIIINNRIVREGDLISNGLSLKQIDPDGVVLQYERSVFRVKLF